MNTKLYMVYDLVAKLIFGNLIRCTNDEVARRTFHDALGDANGPFAKHQGDFELRYVADLDETTGIITPLDIPFTIMTGTDWLNANKEGTK